MSGSYNAVLIVVCAALLVVCGFVAGAAWRGEHARNAATEAAAQVATCVSDASVAQAANAALAGRIDAWRTQHDERLAQAERSLADRPATIAHTQARAAARATSIAHAQHEDPACTALVDLPVCAAVARQLWPARQQTDADRDAPHRD